MTGFVFNSDVVVHLLIVVAGIVACFVAVGALVYMMTGLVERDCRRDLWYDDDGRKDG